jgi:hypothetical protein
VTRRVLVAIASVCLLGLLAAASQARHSATVPYEGGPVLHANRTHLIFWEPAGSGMGFDPGYVGLVERFMRDVAHDSRSTTNVLGITGQYADSEGPAAYASRYDGAVIATDPLPANGCAEPSASGPGWSVCLTDAQLRAEIEHVVSADQMPRSTTNVYILVTPDGLGDCMNSGSTSCALGGAQSGYCGYHSATSTSVPYAVIPYNAVPGHCLSSNPRPNSSTADPVLSTIVAELAGVLTDPLGDAWIDHSGQEIGGLCTSHFGRAIGGSGQGRWNETIGGHHYYLQELYSRVTGGCAARPATDSVTFTSPGRTRAGKTALFAANARQPGGRIAGYDWTFGDGGRGSGRRITHIYAQTGIRRVTLRVVDSAGNWAFASRTVNVGS